MIVHPAIEQRSPEWWALRLGKPTASEFSKIITSKGEPSKSASTYAVTLACELFAGKALDGWEGNSYTERGRELEVTALELYEFTREVELTRVGFITDNADTMGCSPDALIGDDGMAEVKCLKAENHAKAILYYEKHGRCPTDYVQQTQGQLMIGERKWCDLIFYHPELPLLVIRQEPLREVRGGLIQGIADVIRERDNVLDILRSRGSAQNGTAPSQPRRPAIDLSVAAPLF